MPSYVNPQVDHNLYGTLIPQFPTEMAAKLLQNRQQKYDIGLAAVRSKTSSMLDMESKMLSPYMKKTVSDYNKQVNEKLQKFSTADFSIQSNVDAVSSLYDPLMKDELFLQEYMTSIGKSRTEQHIYEMATSDNEEVRDGFSENNYLVWKNKYSTLENAESYNEALKGVKEASGAMYTPYYDPMDDFETFINNNKIIDVSEDVREGGYIVTYSNGTLAKKTASQLVTLGMSEKAKTQFRIDAEAELLRFGDDSYSQAITSTIPLLERSIRSNNDLILQNENKIKKLGDTERSKQQKEQLQEEIDIAKATISNYTSQKNRLESLSEKYKNGSLQPQDWDLMKRIAINSLGSAKEEEFMSNMIDFFSDRNSQTKINEDTAYSKLIDAQNKATELELKYAEQNPNSQTAIGTAVSTGTIENADRKDTDFVDDLMRSIHSAKSQVNSQIIDEYYGLDDKYHNFYTKTKQAITLDEKLKTSNPTKYKNLKNKTLIELYNDNSIPEIKNFIDEIKLRSEGEDNKEFYEKILNSTLESLTTENGKLKNENGEFLDPVNFKNPLIAPFLEDYKLFYDNDADVNLTDEQISLFQRYDEQFEIVSKKEKTLKDLQQTPEYKKANEELKEKVIHNPSFDAWLNMPYVNITTFMDQTSNGDWIINDKKIKNFITNMFVTNNEQDERLKNNMFNELKQEVENTRTEVYDKALNKALSKNPNLINDKVYQKQSLVYTGNEARKFMDQSELSANLIASFNNMLKDSPSTDIVTPVITSLWYKDLDSSGKEKALDIMKYMIVQGAYSSVVAGGDGTLQLTYSGQMSTLNKGEGENVTATAVSVDKLYDNDAEAKEIMRKIMGEGIKLDNVARLEALSETDPILSSIMSNPGSKRTLITNKSKNFDVTIKSRKNSTDGSMNFDLESKYYSIGGIPNVSTRIVPNDLLNNVLDGNSITSIAQSKSNFSLKDSGALTDKNMSIVMSDFIERNRKIHNFVNTEKGKSRYIEILQNYINEGKTSITLKELEDDILEMMTEN